ncbi:CDP-glycerol glycerophosphotransferase family protein [Dyadobacter sp. 676]|uniref:CDP-glycerol glycerophosphotransferase family protein n=1 Tax=Dyadobacter sp. 676 TaxID=3088362 RepID=A0AAU8FTB9_9BACT
MEKSDKQHLLILVTNPFAILNLIHSGLAGELDKTFRISIMSDLLTKVDVNRFNEHFHLEMQWLATPVPTLSILDKWLRTLQMLIFGYYFDLATLRIKLTEYPALHWLFSVIWQALLLRSFCGRLLVFMRTWLIRRTGRPARYGSLPEQEFCAVLSSSPLDLRENKIVNFLKAKGIRCIAMIISWDNLTSKGVMNMQPDLVLVWNKLMSLEYRRLYSFWGNTGLVRIIGIPRFDIYFKEAVFTQKQSDFKRLLGISCDTRIILYSTGAAKHHICQNYIIEDLLTYARARQDMMVVVRCHPHDAPERYLRYDGIQNLRILWPMGENDTSIPPPDFLEMLASQLAACDVCVQVASTIFLEAAACNKPTIGIAYDEDPDIPYIRSVRRFYDYSHQLPLDEFLPDHTVRNKRDLFEKLDEILAGGHSRKNLREAIKPFIHYDTPDSVRFTAQCIREWLD